MGVTVVVAKNAKCVVKMEGRLVLFVECQPSFSYHLGCQSTRDVLCCVQLVAVVDGFKGGSFELLYKDFTALPCVWPLYAECWAATHSCTTDGVQVKGRQFRFVIRCGCVSVR